jgi:hypothetical protein
MTLVCATHYNFVPLLIGDVLLSGDRPEHAEVATFDNVEKLFFPRSEKIVGVASKLALIKPKLAVGWSGSLIYARSVIRYLQETLTDTSSLEDLKVAFLQYEKIQPDSPVELVGSLVFGQNKGTIFNWKGYEHGKFSIGAFFTSGSGSETFQAELAPLPLYYSKPDVYPEMDAVSWAIERVGFLLGGEILRGANLPDYFGGGFDVAFFDGHTFRRIASLIQLFVDLDLVWASEPGIPVVLPSGYHRHARYKMQTLATTFWQTFRGGLVLERIYHQPLSYSSVKRLRSSIKSRRVAKAPVFQDLDCGESAPTGPRFVIIHRRLLASGIEYGVGSQVYRLPNSHISIFRDGSSVRVRLSEAFLQDQAAILMKILEKPELREKMEQARAAGSARSSADEHPR